MNAIIPLLTTAVLMLGLAAPQAAQSAPEVPLGDSWYSFGGDLVKVEVTENPDVTVGNSWVQGVDASGFSTVADGTGTTTGCTNSGVFSTGNDTYKVSDGKVYRKSKTKAGKWVKGKKVRNPRTSKTGRSGGSMSVIYIIADEVVSLPGGPPW
jgi:hypothetical protein